MAERIAGIALMPRQSRNGVYYDTEELKKFDGKTVPLRVEHNKETHIGQVTFSFDEEKSQVKYEATVFDSEWQKTLENEQYQVSIGASVLEQRTLCDEMKAKCLNAPVLDEILELSVVRTPGIPESTLHVVESHNAQYIKILNEQEVPASFGGFVDPIRLRQEITDSIKQKNPDLESDEIDRKSGELLGTLEVAFMRLISPPPQLEPTPQEQIKDDNTSNKETPVNQDMTTEISEKKVEEKVKVTIETDGEVEVGKAEAKTEVAPTTDAPAKVEDAKEDASDKVAERIEKSNSETLKAVIETVKENWNPKSEVAESTNSGYVEEAYTEGRDERDWVDWCLDYFRTNGYPGIPTLDEFLEQNIGVYSNPIEKGKVALQEFREDPLLHPLDTPSGLIEIFSQQLYENGDPEKIPPIPKYIEEWDNPFNISHQSSNIDYPLQAIGHHTFQRVHSTHDNNDWLAEAFPQRVFINPIDALSRGLVNGEQVLVHNRFGKLSLPCRITNRIMPGVIDIPEGAWWKPDSNGVDRGGNINVLTSHQWTPYAFGSTQHTIMVQVCKTPSDPDNIRKTQ